MAAGRWWVYQRERFPVFAHGPLILAFSSSALSFSSLLRGARQWPAAAPLSVAFATCLLFFLQLRIADEFKDFDEDSRYRPYRPVPRGLVTLRELAVVFALAAAVQLGLALWLSRALTPLLVLTWAYLALMSVEFFARRWLKARPVVYLLSHMAILPLVDLYATACDWRLAGGGPPPGLFWFLAVSYANGVVIEIGRKLRAPEDEEEGVETYTALWGRPAAVAAWLGAMAATGALALRAATLVRFEGPAGAALGAVFLGSAALAAAFLRCPRPGRGRRFEAASGVWTLCLYLGLGVVPLALALAAGG